MDTTDTRPVKRTRLEDPVCRDHQHDADDDTDAGQTQTRTHTCVVFDDESTVDVSPNAH